MKKNNFLLIFAFLLTLFSANYGQASPITYDTLNFRQTYNSRVIQNPRETEIGCVSMSLDAIMLAAAIADACVTCPAYLANKTIMIFLKTVNRVSKAAGGYLTKGLLALFEKFRSGAISAAEFITKISEYSGLKKLLENGGEAALRDAESVMGRLLGLGCSVVKTRDSRSSPADCDPAVLASLVTNASNALQQAGLDPAEFWKNMRRICGDAGSSEECLQGAENLLNKLKTQGNSPQNMKGLFYEAKWAAAVKNFGTKPIRITTGEEFTAVNALTGAVEKSEAELLGIRLSDGATVWDDVKSTLQWTDSNIGISGSYVKDLEQAAKFARVAKANGFVPRYAVYNIPFVSCVAVRELINLGIEVVDGNTGLNITLSNFNPQC